jgi:hypothetical protein
MKIHKSLRINATPANLVSMTIRLDLFTPGRALITCTGGSPAYGQLVEINAALADNDSRRVFMGFVESVTQIKTGVYQILARELSAALNKRIALNIRHCTPAQVLTEISQQTGIEFLLPENAWCNQTNARFQHVGLGYGALDAILKLWSVTKGVWIQQSDGRIYVGEIEGSIPGSRTITLEPNLFTHHSITGGTLPLIPRLRPGVHISFLDTIWIVHSVELSGEIMRVNWMKNPWSNKLKAIA